MYLPKILPGANELSLSGRAFLEGHLSGLELVQDYSNSIANALELL